MKTLIVLAISLTIMAPAFAHGLGKQVKYYEPNTGALCISEYDRAERLAAAWLRIDSTSHLETRDWTMSNDGSPDAGTYNIQYHTVSDCKNVNGKAHWETCDGTVVVRKDFTIVNERSKAIQCVNTDLKWSCQDEDTRNAGNNGYGQ